MFDLPGLLAEVACLPSSEQFAARTYIGEAVFFDHVLTGDAQRLAPGDQVIEVGSGMGLLSMLIADRGLQVHAYEPLSAGFTRMRRLRALALRHWSPDAGEVVWHDYALARRPHGSGEAAWAISINVIEHVPTYRALIADTMSHVRNDGCLTLIFPNYLYPYEPHFHMPTLLSKRLTAHVMRTRISGSSLIDDPWGFWSDLSWPTGTSLARTARRAGFRAAFTDRATLAYLQRAHGDDTFTSRKAGFPAAPAVLAQLARIVPRLPSQLLPVVDCAITTRH